MNKKNQIIIGVVGVVTVLIGILFTQPAVRESSESGSDTDDKRVAEENRKRVKELYQSPRESLAGNAKELSPDCQEFWSGLRGLDLRTLSKDTKSIRNKTSSEKCSAIPLPLKAVHDYFNSACKEGADPSVCWTAIYHYRAAISDYLTKEVPLSEIKDPRILLDKMLANREINPELSLKAAERLAEVEPNLYEARKAQVLGRLFLATKKPEQSESAWNSLEDSIQKARELSKLDPELLEAELYAEIARSSSWEHAIEKSQEVAEEFPQEWRGPYFAAWGLFKEGRGQEALDYLLEAQKRDPQNQRVKLAIEGIKKGDANPFQVNISYNDLSQYD